MSSLTVDCPPTAFYTWQNYRCAYEVWSPDAAGTPLLLIHPIGVGLSRRFWDRFIQAWRSAGYHQPIYNVDLLGCGESEMPRAAYRPEDWANQLLEFWQTVGQRPVIVIAQGALSPVAIELCQQADPQQIRAMVLSGPPAWALMSKPTAAWQQNLSWNLFNSLLGLGFYQYAKRRQFIRSFSARQLFDHAEQVDAEWLDRLAGDAENQASRHAVFSFLAGFWRQDYRSAMANIPQPTLIVMGKTASSISRSGRTETPQQRLADYLQQLPHATGVTIPGRNVLPYESASEFVQAIGPFVTALKFTERED